MDTSVYLHDLFNQRDILQDSSTMSSEMEPPKKKRHRARLDHLSIEEKRERRKEKNRQAAQTARDRKRDNMDRLKAENEKLRAQLKLARDLLSKHQIIPNSKQNPLEVDNASSNQPHGITAPHVQIINHDSGVSDTETISKASSPNPLIIERNNMDLLTVSKLRIASNSPDSFLTINTSGYDNACAISPAPTEEDQLIDSFIGQHNEQELTHEVRKVVSYIDHGMTSSDVPFGSAVSIKCPLQQVQVTSIKPDQKPIVNSLGWTSMQLMLVILISRIHHRSSATINCCLKEREEQKTSFDDERGESNLQASQQAQPRGKMVLGNIKNISIVDYILNTRCDLYRRTVEGIIFSKEIARQRGIALKFINKCLGLKLS